jgi:hypothetical protein
MILEPRQLASIQVSEVRAGCPVVLVRPPRRIAHGPDAQRDDRHVLPSAQLMAVRAPTRLREGVLEQVVVAEGREQLHGS